jgi:hypothetical protein
LPKEHAQNRPDHTAYNITDVSIDLIEALTVANDDHAYQTEQLDRLQDIHNMACEGSIDAESDVAVICHGIAV